MEQPTQPDRAEGPNAYLALVHHPVRDKVGDTITTSVTNLDVHDLARLCRTFELKGYFIITPVRAQQELVRRILGHWKEGSGKKRLPNRTEALALVTVVGSLEEAQSVVQEQQGHAARVLVTAAKSSGGAELRTFAQERAAQKAANQCTLLVLGTGHGLTHDLIAGADALLEPVKGRGDYNHLSVRAAAAIIIDRLYGVHS